MSGVAVSFQKETRAFRQNDFGLENALAGYVRRRWPDKTIPHVQHEWDLSESEAAKVVYAGASKNTLRKLLHHKRGGFGLFVNLLADATGTSLEAYIDRQAEEARRERAQWEARERHLAALAARLPESGGVHRLIVEQAGSGRTGHGGLVSSTEAAPDRLAEPRTFDGGEL